LNSQAMQRRKIGVVAALWRYPVKSMRGEALSAATVTPHGLAGDRQWAVRECEYGGVVSARAWPAMLQLRAAWTRDPTTDTSDSHDPRADSAARVRIEMPDGSIIHAGDSAASRVVSDFLRREVRLERVHRAPITPEQREAIMHGEAMPPARDYFDEDVMHLIASGTLAHLRALAGGASDFDPRRFRANILVDTGTGDDRFVEDQWLDGKIEIGAAAQIIGMRPALRCAITTHPQDELPHDPAILRTAWQYHQAYAGIFAAVGAQGTIRIGDPIYLREIETGAD
jgi:MOSC domain-containing protein